MKKIIKILFLIAFILFFIIFFIKLFNQPNEAIHITKKLKIKPVVDLTLREVLLSHWNKSIIDISLIYEGGKIERHSPQKNMLSSYTIDAKVKDIKQPAKIIFYQNEKFARNKKLKNISLRKIIFISDSLKKHKILFESLSNYLVDLSAHGTVAKKSSKYKGPFLIIHPDNSKLIHVELKKNNIKTISTADNR